MSEGNGLPKGWVLATVGEVGEVRLGRQRSPSKCKGVNPTKYVRAANITRSGIDLTDVLEMDFDAEEKVRYALKEGDVLLSEASGSAGEVGKPVLWRGVPETYCFQNTVIRFRTLDASSAFALHVFDHYSRSGIFSEASRGVGIHHLGADRFSLMPFPLPPLPEQHRIVDAIDELFSDLDAGVANLERAKANLKRCRASVLKSAVEGRLTEEWRKANPQSETGKQLLERILRERRSNWEREQLAAFKAKGKSPPKDWQDRYEEPAAPDTDDLPELPEGWVWGSMERITSAERVICYGILMPKDDVADGVLYVKVRDMKGDRVDVGNLNRTAIEIARKFPRSTLREDDLLLSIRGTFGRVAIVPKELEGGNITQDTARIAVLRGIEHRFVANWLRSDFSQRYLKQVARGVAVKGVNIGDIRPMPIPLPPLREQHRIVALVEERLSQIDFAEKAIEQGLERAKRLRQSILKRAFEGRLVPQDPNDEPASVLLERIKASSVEKAPKKKVGRNTTKAKAR